ncbi:copper transport protein ATX1-like isoform X2 [Panicum virgatum]|uniref:copper transport protein ATX1-like isoform X2 n=1 Tax=Panicum virgatum TaxID=38727 RepID=UPI0019D672B6|nr:copper transport protein ATX1-like isoform X2 [Panicum virgatum]
MAAETVVLKVAMSCQGCAGAVRRVLSKMEGVETFDIDLKEQKVTVKGNVKPEDVFQTVSKSGKKTSYWEGEATAQAAPAPAAEAAPSTEAEAPAAEAAPESTPAEAAAPEITPVKSDA